MEDFPTGPELERATVDNSLMEKEADSKKLLCEVDEKECNIKRLMANKLRNDC